MEVTDKMLCWWWWWWWWWGGGGRPSILSVQAKINSSSPGSTHVPPLTCREGWFHGGDGQDALPLLPSLSSPFSILSTLAHIHDGQDALPLLPSLSSPFSILSTLAQIHDGQDALPLLPSKFFLHPVYAGSYPPNTTLINARLPLPTN